MKKKLSRQPSDSEIIERLSGVVTPPRWEKIQKVAAQRISHMAVVIEDIYDRGNASAVMRSMEAFGFYQLHMIELHEKFKESQRVTQGADKWLNIKKWPSTASCVKALKDEGRKIYVTHLDPGAQPLEDIDTSEPFALCFGNEKKGASEELLKLADKSVFIPMRGFVQSFNISVAAAVSFYSLQNKIKSVKISSQEKDRLQAFYLTQTIENWEVYF